MSYYSNYLQGELVLISKHYSLFQVFYKSHLIIIQWKSKAKKLKQGRRKKTYIDIVPIFVGEGPRR